MTSVVVGVILATSTLYIVAAPQHAHALILDTLRDTTQSVIKQLTSPGETSNPTSTMTTQASSSPVVTSTQQPTTASSQASSPQQSDPAVSDSKQQSAEQLPLITSDLQKINFSTPKNRVLYAGITLPTRSTERSLAFLQATPEGWRVLGVLWYWWLAAIAVLALIVLAVKRNVYGRFKHKLLYQYHKIYDKYTMYFRTSQ